ncbi:MFS transporter [Desulfopila aestuarii]|uniref:Predicted arabinose efflux permease, MFS family n=1 Tax=Desulfopila aestuarii DSM 18488 TaxID=1121416 RepID=A0A1M7YIQ4_9BACT|nr:MFS transporter [Desulfopila aestuarii]SHO52496.1 Predicted arabinose efflux permease, MFS family [Desulfopila aestuarii DSM 18488]
MDKAPLTKSRFYALLIACGVLLSTMDSSMVNVALPEIMRSFEVGIGEVKLVVLIYLMVITFSLVFWGRIGDEFGKGRVYITGMVVFACGAVVCAVSTLFSLLIIARAVQAVGAAMMMATGPAILKFVSPREHLGKTLGFVGVATSCGLMTGPLISGFILSVTSWRGVFLVPVPLAAMAALLGSLYLLPDLRKREELHHQKFDWQGGLLWVGFVVAFVLLANGTLPHWYFNIVMILAIIFLLYLFFKVEKRAEAPILPLVLVRRRYYWTGVATAGISFGALFIVLILLPFYLDYILQYSPRRIGLVMMALPVSLVVMSPMSGWLYDRLGSARVISTVGLLISTVAVLCLLLLDGDSSFFGVCWRLTLLGAGQSVFLSPNSASVLSKVQDSYAGITSGILATARNFGMLSGTALAGTTFSLLYGRLTSGKSVLHFTHDYGDAFLFAQRSTLAIALLLLFCGCLISWSRGR